MRVRIYDEGLSKNEDENVASAVLSASLLFGGSFVIAWLSACQGP